MEEETANRMISHHDLRRYITAFDASFDGIAVIDRDKRILYSNCANAAGYGYTSKYELIGKSWHARCSEKEMKRFEDEIIPLAWKNGRWRGELSARDGTGPSSTMRSLLRPWKA